MPLHDNHGNRSVFATGFFAIVVLGLLAPLAAVPAGEAAPNGHAREASANLLPNGHFAGERGEGVPSPWRAALTSAEVDHARQGTERVSVGVSAPANIAGDVTFGRAALRRLARAPADAVAALPPGDEPDPDPVQGLDSLIERHGHKPYDLFERGDELMTLRLIFRDRRFGTPVWMLDTSPTVDHGGTASVWSAWNSDGSTIRIEGARPIGGELHRGWYFHSDFSRMRPGHGGRPAVWSPDDPDVFYGPVSPGNQVTRTHWRTGRQEVIAEWDRLRWPGAGKRVYGLTRDRRLRIGSPTEPELIDWGLRAGAEYHYAVTAVDRQGNESALGPVVSVATPPREAPSAVIELHFADAALEGPFERSTAAGTRGEAYLVPEDAEANRVSWQIDVPRAGQYYFWLRYLHRGSGGRGDAVRQHVRAAIDGRRVTTLGGGSTDLHVPDRLIAPESRLAERLWTWAWPGAADLEAVELPEGRHTLTLSNLPKFNPCRIRRRPWASRAGVYVNIAAGWGF